MTKKRKGLSDDYKLEIENALEKAIQTPVGSDLEAKVVDVEIPDTVEQLLQYAQPSAKTEYSDELKVYDTSTESESTDYWYRSNAESVTTSDSQSATYNITVQEQNTLKNAQAEIASAALYNTFGVQDASVNITDDARAKMQMFKDLHWTDWIFFYDSASWLVFNI
jgi:hypothetical protein